MSGLTHEIKKIIPGPPGNVFSKMFFFQNIPWMVLEIMRKYEMVSLSQWRANP